MENRLTRVINKFNFLPTGLRQHAISWAIGTGVPYIGTSKLFLEKTTNEEWIAVIKNRRRTQNHIKQVHAAAMLLLAETVAVFVTAMNLPDDKLPLVKKIDGDFVKRSTGGMRAIAKLSKEQIVAMQTTEKGDAIIEVVITDEAGINPVLVKVTSAWITKEKKE